MSPTSPRAWILLACVLASGCETTPDVHGPADSAWAAHLDALIAQHAGPETPGLAIGIVQDGQLVAASYGGLADLEHRVPVTCHTRFHVASVSKQFTGFAVQLLVKRGRIALADRVGDHLDDMPEIVSDLTIEQLLHHTSGLRQELRLLAIAGRRNGRVLQHQEALDLIRAHRELNFPPGTRYSYSNSNYALLAAIVEAVTGARFADWMEEHVFAPLNLERTQVVDSYYTIVPDRARPYGQDGDRFFNSSSLLWALYGGTGVHTTLEDLAAWAAFVMDPPPDYADVIAAMLQPGTLSDGTKLRYASGLQIEEHRGMRHVSHGGTGDGAHAYVSMFPEQKLGVVLMENAELVDAARTAVTVADLVFDGAEEDNGERRGSAIATSDSARRNSERTVPALGEDLRARIAGRFLVLDEKADHMPQILRFEREGDGLVMAMPQGGALPLTVASPQQLRVARTPARLEFPEGDAPAMRMTLRFPGGSQSLVRLAEEGRPDAPDDYLGTYHSPEIDTEFEVARVEGALALVHPVHGEVALQHVRGDTFGTDRNAIRWILFERGEDQAIRGFRLTNHNGRVTRLWFERLGDKAPAQEDTGR